MNEHIPQLIRESYDRLADEYAHRIFNELQHSPRDRELPNWEMNLVPGASGYLEFV